LIDEKLNPGELIKIKYRVISKIKKNKDGGSDEPKCKLE
jgi:hypothetical protein